MNHGYPKSGVEHAADDQGDSMKSLADVVKQLRDANGWSQQTLADHAGIPQQTLSALELGAKPSWETVRRLCAALGVKLTKMDEMLGPPEIEKPSVSRRRHHPLTASRRRQIRAAVKAGLTLTQVAGQFGCSKSYVSMILRGKR